MRLGEALISRPKLKHIVLPSWVEESLEEETLMDEDCEQADRTITTDSISPQTQVAASFHQLFAVVYP